MSRVCELTGKKPMVGHTVSHSNIKTKRRYLPNLVNVTDNCLSSVVVTQSKAGLLLGNTAGIGYLTKNLLTNSEGQFMKKDK